MSLGIRPLSVAMPLAALFMVATVSLISALSTLWSVMSTELHSIVVLFIVFIAAIAAAILLFVQSRGIASILPYKFQDYLVNSSLLDTAQSVWRKTGDIADAAILIGLRLDRDHSDRALARLPSPVRKALTQPGIINFLPDPVSNLILPEHIRRRLQRLRVPIQNRVEDASREQFLTPLILEVSERRILSLSRALFKSIMSKNPLLRLSQKHFRALMFLFSCVAFFRLIRSRSKIQRSFNTFQIMVFILAMSVNIMKLNSPSTSSHALARQRTGSPVLNSRHVTLTRQKIPYRRLIMVGTSAIAIGVIYTRFRKNKRLL